MLTIYIVDDDKHVRGTLLEFLGMEGYNVQAFPTGEEALDHIERYPPDVILLDFMLPGIDGLEVLRSLTDQVHDIKVIMITGFADVKSSVEAMKLGAIDYIRKPFELEEIRLVILKVKQQKMRDEQLAYLRQESQAQFRELLGESDQIREIFTFIQTVSESPSTSVMIRGETGTGKELVAKEIHYNSPRSAQSFIEINCSSGNEAELDAILFGYEPDAFTGAHTRKKGLIELAHRGTLFLGEVGEVSLDLQAKLQAQSIWIKW